MRARESAKCGQNHQPLIDKVAGDFRFRSVEIRKRDSRVYVPAHDMRTLDLTRLMAESDLRFMHRPVQTRHLPLITRIARVPIVIAADHFDRERCEFVPPVRDRVERRILSPGLPVKEISQHQQSLGGVLLDDRGKGVEIVRGRAHRHRHAGFAKERCLAKVRIRNNRRLAARPDQRALRGEHPFLAGKLRFQHLCLPMTG